VDRVVLLLGIITAAAFIGYLTQTGRYYLLPLWERPDNPLHLTLRPSGSLGHLLGIIGTCLVIVGVILYSSRKRIGVLQGRGPMRTWLNVHIYLCLVGPTLVLLHSALKFGGFAAWSFWSMAIVAGSGIAGRWIYQQFPRTIRGQEMSLEEIQAEQATARELLERAHAHAPQALAAADAFAAASVARFRTMRGPLGLPRLFLDDVLRPFRLATLRRRLRRQGRLPRQEVLAVIGLVRTQVTIARRVAFLDFFRRLFLYWHVTHMIFFVAMFVLLIVHVGAAIMFGAVAVR
jgi:hypothetical protein